MFGGNKTETTSYFEEFIPFEKTLKTETSQEKLSSALKRLEWSRSKLAAIQLKIFFILNPAGKIFCKVISIKYESNFDLRIFS
mgnify:CR=1 FL=1